MSPQDFDNQSGDSWLEPEHENILHNYGMEDYLRQLELEDLPLTEEEAISWAEEDLEVAKEMVLLGEFKYARRKVRTSLQFMMDRGQLEPKYIANWVSRLHLIALGPLLFDTIADVAEWSYGQGSLEALWELESVVESLVGVPGFRSANKYQTVIADLATKLVNEQDG